MATKLVKVSPAYQGERCTLAVETDLPGAFRYHWMKNGMLIPGAPSEKTYTTHPLRAEDLDAKYSVRVYSQNSIETSDELPLTEEAKKEG
jgi:hypothetical protein